MLREFSHAPALCPGVDNAHAPWTPGVTTKEIDGALVSGANVLGTKSAPKTAQELGCQNEDSANLPERFQACRLSVCVCAHTLCCSAATRVGVSADFPSVEILLSQINLFVTPCAACLEPLRESSDVREVCSSRAPWVARVLCLQQQPD